MKKQDGQYNLLTAISMIVGICIGSGIFFKADDVLSNTGGNVALGVVVFVIGALGIIFGSLSFSELAGISTTEGGLIGYFNEFVSPKVASAFAWFQTFLYLPSINVVVSWVAGVYTLQMIRTPFSLEKSVLIGTGYLLLFYIINYFSIRFGDVFQKTTTVIKLVPLILIAILGLVFGSPLHEATQSAVVQTATTHSHPFAWMMALTPIAFSYDGWTIILNISGDIKNGKRNIPLALFIGPLVVLGAYLAYFIGLVKILGVDKILSLGDNAIYEVGTKFLGANGGNLITLVILISILGVTNGITIGSIRMPEVLMSRRMIKGTFKGDIESVRPTKVSLFLSLGCTLFWMLVHYLTQRFNIFNGGDISELAVTFSYACYLVLYIRILQLRTKGTLKKNFKNGISPILGIVSSLMILAGAIMAKPSTAILFICVGFIICGLGYLSYKKLNPTD